MRKSIENAKKNTSNIKQKTLKSLFEIYTVITSFFPRVKCINCTDILLQYKHGNKIISIM